MTFPNKWAHKVNVSDVFHNDDLSLETKAETIAKRLWAKFPEGTELDLDNALEELIDAGKEDDVSWFDGAWNFIYDWADVKRVWIETRA